GDVVALVDPALPARELDEDEAAARKRRDVDRARVARRVDVAGVDVHREPPAGERSAEAGRGVEVEVVGGPRSARRGEGRGPGGGECEPAPHRVGPVRTVETQAPPASLAPLAHGPVRAW